MHHFWQQHCSSSNTAPLVITPSCLSHTWNTLPLGRKMPAQDKDNIRYCRTSHSPASPASVNWRQRHAARKPPVNAIAAATVYCKTVKLVNRIASRASRSCSAPRLTSPTATRDDALPKP